MGKSWALAAACAAIAGLAWLRFFSAAPDVGWDFPQFYIAGHIPIAELYDRGSFEACGRSVLAGNSVSYYPPYVRPAVFALFLRPMRALSYRTAFVVWVAAQGLFLLLAALLLGRIFPAVPRLYFLPFLAFFPAVFGILFGQDAAFMLLLLAGALYCLTSGRELAGGVLLGIGLYKFNVVLLLPVYLLMTRQWRAFFGFALTGALVAALSAWLAPPAAYIHLLAHIPDVARGFLPELMIGIRGLAATLGSQWLYAAGVIVIAPLALIAAARSDPRTGFSIALAGSMLCAYHINGYDGTLAALPLVALMAKTIDSPLQLIPVAGVLGLSRPPMWLSPLLMLALLAGLIALRRPIQRVAAGLPTRLST